MTSQPRSGMFQAFAKYQNPRDRAATLSQNLINIRSQSLQESLSDFENTEHTLETVKSIEGVDFINDSRATNANAVWYALESMYQPTTWITCMNSSDLITEDLKEVILKKVKIIVVQAAYNSYFYEFLKNLGKDVYVVANMEDAVRTAFYASSSYESVLFSPGVVSQGAYKTYRERGASFKEAVAQL